MRECSSSVISAWQGSSAGRARAGADTRFGLFREVAVIIFIAAVVAAFSCVFIHSKHFNGPPIRSDGFGYYSYLPSVFIDHDLELASARRNMPEGTTSFDFGINKVEATGRYFNKYAIGTALLQSPFFLGAHIAAGLASEPQSGYSGFYQIGNTSSAIVYLCLGMYFLYVAIRTMLSRKAALATVVMSVFATNVFHYATYDASFSHIYQFALTSMLLDLLLQARQAKVRPSVPMVVGLGAVTGLIALTRLTNITFAVLPLALFVERWISDRNLKVLVSDSMLAGIVALCVLFPQLAYWKYSTGHWFVNAYQMVGEDARFYWTKPEVINFLFSVRKGALFWCPLLVVGLFGMPALIRRLGLLGWALALVLCLHVYICASWYYWSFGGSFGSRPMVDVMPMFALAIAMVIQRGLERRQAVILAFTALVILALNIALMYSYWRGYIPFDNTDLSTILSLPSRLKAGY